VTVSARDERAHYADPYRWIPDASLFAGSNLSLSLAAAATNHAARRARFNEAELVRERREAADVDESGSGVARLNPPPRTAAKNPPETSDSEPDVPIVRDPVLARALDLLKGLAVVRQYHS
jgi:hypothetical protein